MQADQDARYSGVAMLLHWLLALGVIVNWRLAESAHEGPREAAGGLMATHMAIGMTILVLTVLRIVWRLVHRPPPLASTLHTWERVLARTVHALFYVLLITLPLLGWIATSSAGKSIDWFGVFEIPALPVRHDPAAGDTIFEVHHFLGSVTVYLMFLHILVALKHTLWDKDGNLFRMLPFGRPKA
jgi:cytochrome b561